VARLEREYQGAVSFVYQGIQTFVMHAKGKTL
jgi:hypothetical protein